MGRKQTNTVEYFPHYANASEKDTLTIIQNYFGNDGYAFWFKLLEKLCSSEGHYIDCNNAIKWECFVSKANITVDKAYNIVVKLVELGAIDSELWTFKVIWCQNLINNLEDVYHNRKREVPQKPSFTQHNIKSDNYPNLPVVMPISTTNLPVDTPISTDKPTIFTPESTQSKVEYSRVNKSKVHRSNVVGNNSDVKPIDTLSNTSKNNFSENNKNSFSGEVSNSVVKNNGHNKSKSKVKKE